MGSRKPTPLTDLSVYDVLVTALREYPGNPRRGNVDAIAESLRVNGQYRPLVVWKETQQVLAGNHTLKAAQTLGWEKIKVTFVEGITEEQATKIVLADNRMNDVAEYNTADLTALLESVSTYEGTGYTDFDVATLLSSDGDGDTYTDPDDSPQPTLDRPVSGSGDVWLLGEHRLAVGDATTGEAYRAALGDQKADFVWTDPPYGVNYVGKTRDALTIQNDGAAGLEALLKASFGEMLKATRPGACWFVAGPPGPPGVTFGVELDAIGVLRQKLVWVKQSLVMGHSDYHYRHEDIYFGWTPGAAHQPPSNRTQTTVIEFGDAPDFSKMSKAELVETLTGLYATTTVWEVDRPAANREHPTMKPIDLITPAIENHTQPGEVVLDPFAGSGSTLIAAHRTGRVARVIEMDPRYADVICRRFEEHTRIVPVLEATGERVSFVAGADGEAA